MDPERPFLLALGDWILAVGVIPTLIFVFEYGIFRWVRRHTEGKFVPWWRSSIGVMIFLLALGLLCVEANVVASLFLGAEYPGRELFRLVGYSISTVSAMTLLVVYAREGGKASVEEAMRTHRASSPEAAKSQ